MTRFGTGSRRAVLHASLLVTRSVGQVTRLRRGSRGVLLHASLLVVCLMASGLFRSAWLTNRPGLAQGPPLLVTISCSLLFALVAISTAIYISVGFRRPRSLVLHWHGLLLALMVLEVALHAATVVMWCRCMYVYMELAYVGIVACFTFRKVSFLILKTQAFASMGENVSRAIRSAFRLAGSVAVLGSIAAFSSLHLALHYAQQDTAIHERGTPLPRELQFATIPIISTLAYVVGFLLFLGLSAHFGISCHCVISEIKRKVLRRKPSKDSLNTFLRECGSRHTDCLVTFLITSFAFLVHMRHSVERARTGVNHPMLRNVLLLDVGPTTVAILATSGIGSLLFQEDADAGDLGTQLWKLLHASVITCRAETVFEGRVIRTPQNRCVVSFPGKFLAEWSSLTWLCEQGHLSSACVFLPVSDPHGRFGRHVADPENPDGNCWCHALYGEPKKWGCKWFEAWIANIREAKRLGLELVVIYFPGQVGQGKTIWNALNTTSREADGLGRSQQAEVAYLERQRYDFLELDLHDWLRSVEGAVSMPSLTP